MSEEKLVYRLRKRAEIRRQIPTRKSVQEGAPDRIADLLEEAANHIVELTSWIDGAKVAVELFDAQTPSQIKWRHDMLLFARKYIDDLK